MAAMVKLSYKEQVQRMREDAIVEAVNRLLAAKGYDAMTVDEVAAEAGIAKASVYKHFASKEDLAAAAMVRALDRAMAFVDGLREDTKAQPFDQLKAVAGWPSAASWQTRCRCCPRKTHRSPTRCKRMKPIWTGSSA